MKWNRLVLSVALAGMTAAPVWADEAETAALKEEIQALKERLSQLEAKVASSAKAGDTMPPTAGEPGEATLTLPSGLQGVHLSGFVDTTYTYNFDVPQTNTNALRVFDTRANSFMINNAQLTLEKPVSMDSPIGFKTEMMFGTDSEVVGSVTSGLGANAHTHGGTAGGDSVTGQTAISDEFELQEAYVDYLAPIGNGLDLKAGKFATLHGAEVIESKDNWNISRSFLFGYAIPFTHTGFRASYPWSDRITTIIGVDNGWDVVDDNNQAKTVEMCLSTVPIDKTSLGVTYMFGADQSGNNNNGRNILDIVAGWQPIEPLQLKLNYDYGWEDDAAGFTNNAVWQGLAGYARYAVNDRLALSTRGEFFNDTNGVRTGISSGINGIVSSGTRLAEWTLTGEYKINSHLLSRLEFRHDWSSEKVFRNRDVGQRSYQDTVALEFVAPF